MSSTVRESSHISRKIVTHGGGGHGQNQYGHHNNNSSNTANNLENNLDALLEDLQTSVSRSATPVRGVRALSPQVDYRAPANTTRIVSEGRTISPTRSNTTTTEKFVTTGNSGAVSGIPGLELLDAELQNVQPGQSKTVAYKQVSYQYKTNLDGSPRDGADSWTMSDNILNTTSSPLVEEIRDRSYEENHQPLSKRHRSPDPPSKSSTINRELLFDTSSTSRSRQTSPLPPSQQRDVSYVQESSSYQVDPRPVQNTVTTIHTNQNLKATHDGGNVEYITIPSPNAAVPINLAPGPNTKVTTTVKTFTYELPGSPEHYLPGSSLPRGVVLPGDQTITYTLPRGGSTDKSITYQTQQINSSTSPGQTISYQVVSPDGPGNTIRYASPPPPEITTKTTSTHKEAKFYREEQHAYPPVSPVQKPVNNTNTIIYHTGPPTNKETVTTVTRNEKYYQVDGSYPNGDGPGIPGNGPHGPNYGPGEDRPDHNTNTTTIIYQNQPAPKIETRTTTINKSQEYYQGIPYPADQGHPQPDYQKPEGPTHTTLNYYTTAPPQTSPPQTNTTIYKYSNTTTTIPPNKFHEDHEVLLPKPFPITGVELYPANVKKPQSPTNGHGPPEKLEDLMASFSDSERSVLADISNQEREQQKLQKSTDLNGHPKKEVEIVPQSPSKVQSKNYAGPPVYYPPGSGEFTKKEEAGGAMSQSSGGWQKGKAKYEYEASSKSKTKSSSGAAVVPVCLPLCCAMPCVIM